MNNLPRQKLYELIHKYGRSLCDEPTRTKGLLSDFCGQYRKEINVLIIALQEGIPGNLLLSSQNSIPQTVTLTRLSKRLHDNLGLDEEAARWAVESWALALNLVSQLELDGFSSTPIPFKDSAQRKNSLPIDDSVGVRPPPVPATYRQEVISPLPTAPAPIAPPGSPDPANQSRPLQYAGFWKRAAAALIDWVIVITAWFVIVVALSTFSSDFVLYAMFPLIAWLYDATLESSNSQGTIGKKALGISVTDLQGNKISFGRATSRYYSKLLSYLIGGIGFIMAGFTEREQALHDIISGCLVVRK
jgi:uncharacterized RDD family membrane protein YckC